MSGVSNCNEWKAGKSRTQTEEIKIEILKAILSPYDFRVGRRNFISRVFIAQCEK